MEGLEPDAAARLVVGEDDGERGLRPARRHPQAQLRQTPHAHHRLRIAQRPARPRSVHPVASRAASTISNRFSGRICTRPSAYGGSCRRRARRPRSPPGPGCTFPGSPSCTALPAPLRPLLHSAHTHTHARALSSDTNKSRLGHKQSAQSQQ